MDLIDRANRFIQADQHRGLSPLLAECVAAGNGEGLLAVKLLARDAYGDSSMSLFAKAPAACCLLAWKWDGLDALVEVGLDESDSGNFSLALQLLSCAAGGQEPQMIRSWLKDGQLFEAVSRSVGDWTDLASAARSHLHDLVLSTENDSQLALWGGTSLSSLSLRDSHAASILTHALALRSIAVGPSILAHYDRLMAEADNDEPSFQLFFETHPLLLDPRAFQVWRKPDFHGKLEPDFLIRTYDNNYVVVEIETPAKRLVTQSGQLSADTTHAINQVLAYQDYLRSHISAAKEAFPHFTTSTGLVVVGRESLLNAKQESVLRRENQSRHEIRIAGFDTLAETANAVTQNVIHGIRETILDARLP